MYCTNCGNRIEENEKFCIHCGAKSINQCYPHTPKNTVACQEKSRIENSHKSSRKKLIIVIVSILTLAAFAFFMVFGTVAVVLIGGVTIFMPRRADFPIEYDEEGIREFAEIVCRNINRENVEYAEVDDVYVYHDASVQIRIKHTVGEEQVVVIFLNNIDCSDQVSSIELIYNDDDSRDKKKCIDAVVEAIENSFCGESKAYYFLNFDLYIPQLEQGEERTLAQYDLTDSACATITIEDWPSSSFCRPGWRGKYQINYVSATDE